VTRRIVAVVPDLMDRSRLAVGPEVEVRFVSLHDLSDPVIIAPGTADLVVVDLSRPGTLEAIDAAAVDVPVVGFGSHVDQELLAAAAIRCTRVLPRSKFFKEWPNV